MGVSALSNLSWVRSHTAQGRTDVTNSRWWPPGGRGERTLHLTTRPTHFHPHLLSRVSRRCRSSTSPRAAPRSLCCTPAAASFALTSSRANAASEASGGSGSSPFWEAALCKSRVVRVCVVLGREGWAE